MNELKRLVVDYNLNRILFDIYVDDGAYKIRITACDRLDINDNVGIEEKMNTDIFNVADIELRLSKYITVLERRLIKRKEENQTSLNT